MANKSNKLSIPTPRSFFEKYSHTKVICPLCGKWTEVIVATLTIQKCTNCHETIEVEFVEIED